MSDLETEYVTNKIMELPSLLDPKSPWEWRMEAMCSRYDVLDFFGGTQVTKCKTVCDTCVVKAQCLDFAVRNKINHGIYGGTTPKERREL